jgi:hypothetical protein
MRCLLLTKASHRLSTRASIKHVKKHLGECVWDSQRYAVVQLSRHSTLHVCTTLRYRFYGSPCESQPANDIRKSTAQQSKYSKNSALEALRGESKLLTLCVNLSFPSPLKERAPRKESLWRGPVRRQRWGWSIWR